MSYCTVPDCALVFPYCGMHGVGSHVLLPLPPLSSSSKRQHERPRGPKCVRPSLLLGMASETAPFARRLLRSSTCADGDHGLGVWALMKPWASGRVDVNTQGKQGSDC